MTTVESLSLEQLADVTEYSDRAMEERYDDYIDECYGETKIAGYSYSTSHALRLVDPVAYRCGFADWTSREIGETIYELHGRYFDLREVDDLVDSLNEGEE
jgi:hypothetical protein